MIGIEEYNRNFNNILVSVQDTLQNIPNKMMDSVYSEILPSHKIKRNIISITITISVILLISFVGSQIYNSINTPKNSPNEKINMDTDDSGIIVSSNFELVWNNGSVAKQFQIYKGGSIVLDTLVQNHSKIYLNHTIRGLTEFKTWWLKEGKKDSLWVNIVDYKTK